MPPPGVRLAGSGDYGDVPPGAAPGPDNRDVQVQAPGQSVFPKQGFGLLLHPNAAGIYGAGERPPPAGDVVLPSGDAPSRNAYVLRPDEKQDIRKFDESMRELTKPKTDGYKQIRVPPPRGRSRAKALLDT